MNCAPDAAGWPGAGEATSEGMGLGARVAVGAGSCLVEAAGCVADGFTTSGIGLASGPAGRWMQAVRNIMMAAMVSKTGYVMILSPCPINKNPPHQQEVTKELVVLAYDTLWTKCLNVSTHTPFRQASSLLTSLSVQYNTGSGIACLCCTAIGRIGTLQFN